MFIVPSSSDSDMDNANQQSRMERDFAKLGLPRGYISRTPSNRGADYGKQAAKTPEITVKQALPVKFVPDVLRSSPKESRSGEKKSLDPSIEIYPELSASSKSQRKVSRCIVTFKSSAGILSDLLLVVLVCSRIPMSAVARCSKSNQCQWLFVVARYD